MEDGNLTPMESKILAAIDDGTLTKEKLEKGVCTLIKMELEQNEHPANRELVSACESLLEKIHQTSYTSNAQESRKTVLTRLEQRAKRKATMQHAGRIAAVLILAFTIGLTSDLLRNRQVLSGQSTVDEQQYIVTGKREIDGVFIQDSLADMQGSILNSRELDEIVDVLGIEPEVPTWLPEGWLPKRYNASSSKYLSSLKLIYANDNSKYLLRYTLSIYATADDAAVAFEQNKAGFNKLVNNTKVYLCINEENTIAVWLKENICYSLSGPIDLDNIMQIIESLQERE